MGTLFLYDIFFPENFPKMTSLPEKKRTFTIIFNSYTIKRKGAKTL